MQFRVCPVNSYHVQPTSNKAQGREDHEEIIHTIQHNDHTYKFNKKTKQIITGKQSK